MAENNKTMPIGSLSRPLKTYKYKFKLFANTSNNKTMDLTIPLVNYIVLNDYNVNVMPIISLNFALTTKQYKFIQDNSSNLYFKMDIERYEAVSMNDNSPLSESYIKDLILNPFDIDKHLIDVSNEDFYDPEKKSNSDSHNTIPFKIDCLISESLSHTKLSQSLIFSNCTVIQVLVALLNMYEFPDNSVLLDIPENNTLYNQIILPPGNFVQQLKYLQNVYGMFTTGYNLYMDHDTNYILKKPEIGNFKTVLKDDNEHSVFYIELLDKDDNDNQSMSSKYIDDYQNKRYYLKMLNQSKINNSKESNKELLGQNVKVMSRNFSSNSKNHFVSNIYTYDNENSKYNHKPKEKIIWNSYSNPFLETEMMNERAKRNQKLTLKFSDINIEYMTPNRIYQIHYTNANHAEEADGLYQLTKLLYQFNIQGEDEGTVSGLCVFDKIE